MSENNKNTDVTGKVFTQEDVDRIVQGRIADEKRKADAEIQKRDTRLACMEYILEKGYSRDIIDLLSYDDIDTFKEKADKFNAMSLGGENTGGTGSSGNFARDRRQVEETEDDKIRRAMGLSEAQ